MLWDQLHHTGIRFGCMKDLDFKVEFSMSQRGENYKVTSRYMKSSWGECGPEKGIRITEADKEF